MSEWTDERPKTFGDCQDKPDPCPWISCKYHMLLDINPRTGSLQFNAGSIRTQRRGPGNRGTGYRVRANLPGIKSRDMRGQTIKTLTAQADVDDTVVELLLQLKHSCVLKVVVDEKSLTLDAVGEVLSITRERVRQIQTMAEDKIRQEPGEFADG